MVFLVKKLLFLWDSERDISSSFVSFAVSREIWADFDVFVSKSCKVSFNIFIFVSTVSCLKSDIDSVAVSSYSFEDFSIKDLFYFFGDESFRNLDPFFLWKLTGFFWS